MLTTRQPAPAARRTVSASRRRLSAPCHAGSVSGKWVPRSPIPAAPKMASATAWATTSASLWPARPRSPANTTPASTRARPASSAKGWTSKPMPTRRPVISARPGRQQGRCQDQVVGRGDLEVGRIARDDHHDPAQRLDQAGVVGRLGRARVGLAQHLGPERLGCLHRDQRRAVQRLDHPLTRDPLDGVGHGHRGDGGVGAGTHRRDDPAEQLRLRQRVARRRARRRSRPSSGTAARPQRTESERVTPPGSAPGSIRSAGRSDHDASHTASAAATDQSRTRRPSRDSNCLGRPKRRPAPAPTTIPQTSPTGRA